MSAKTGLGRYVGPCTIDCPNECEVPEGAVMCLVPRPRHAWSDVLNCPNSDDGCERSFLVTQVSDAAATEEDR